MECAVYNYLDPSIVECKYFSVTTSVTTNPVNGTLIVISVSFVVDNTFPLSILAVDTTGLTRKYSESYISI